MGKRVRKPLLDPEQIDAFRTKEWKALRAFVLSRDGGNCQSCNSQVRGRDWTVAHRTPHNGDPKRFWEPDNLKLLCAKCWIAMKPPLERRWVRGAPGMQA